MKTYTVSVIMLSLGAMFLGGYIIFNKQSPVSLPAATLSAWSNSSSGEGEVYEEPVLEDEEPVLEDEEQVLFTLSLDENVKIFGIDPQDPYIGEPPSSVRMGEEGEEGEELSSVSMPKFELWGDVNDVDIQEGKIFLNAGYPRPIDTKFTPRGPQLSFADIKKGDRIIVSGYFGDDGSPDYTKIEFIQFLEDSVHRRPYPRFIPSSINDPEE